MFSNDNIFYDIWDDKFRCVKSRTLFFMKIENETVEQRWWCLRDRAIGCALENSRTFPPFNIESPGIFSNVRRPIKARRLRAVASVSVGRSSSLWCYSCVGVSAIALPAYFPVILFTVFDIFRRERKKGNIYFFIISNFLNNIFFFLFIKC